MFGKIKPRFLWCLIPALLGSVGCSSLRSGAAQRSFSGTADVAARVELATSCDVDATTRSRGLRIGLLGPLFSYHRLYEGTAIWPWQYVFNVGVSISQCANTVLGGDPDETLSSRLGRAECDDVWPAKYAVAPAVDLLLGPDHCQQCIERDEPLEKQLWQW